MKHFKVFALFLILFAALEANAQKARLYTSNSGLANSHTHDVYQDSKGFIWFCTENGLSRFDGIKFTTFSFDRKNPSSIASNTVRTVFEDSYGIFWVGTASGIQTFDTEYYSFSKVNLEDWSVPDSDQHVNNILEVNSDYLQKIIISTSGHGIYVLNTDTHKIDHELQNKINKTLSSKFINEIFCDSKQRLWISADDGGITVFDLRSELTLSNIWGAGTERLQTDTYSMFFEDHSTGNLIISSTNNGLIIFDSSTGKLRKTKGRSSAGMHIMSMIPDNITRPQGATSFLVGLENQGIKRYDAEKEEIVEVSFPNVSYDISKWKIHSLMEDAQGNVWAGAIQNGVLVIPKSMFGFQNISLDTDGTNSSYCVTSIVEDVDRSCLWIGTDGKGIYRVKRDGEIINLSAENSALSNNSIMALTLDKRGTLWVATYLGGLYTYSEGRGFRKFKDSGKIGAEKIFCLTYTKEDDRIYIGTHGNGFSMADAKEEKVLKVWNDEINKWVSSLYLDSAGLIWIGTYNGPLAYDSKADKLIDYKIDDLNGIRVNSFHEDLDKNIWIGTGEGLVCVERADRTQRIYTQEHGLPSNSITNILEDKDGKLWISTLNGLSHFDPETEIFKNFYQHDGLQENEFNAKAAFKGSNGKLYFGGIQGLTSFRPHRVDTKSLVVPPLYISNLKVMNEDIMYDPEKGSDNILDKQIYGATQITLPNNANMFTLEFSVLEYTNPNRIIYNYKMAGLEKNWNTTLPGSNNATYTNLPSGKYKLQIKAFYEGKPDEYSYKEIGIRILPPWYMSAWAWMVYLTAAGLAIFGFIEARNRKLAFKAHQEESEIKEMKLQMFTNISHEIRTPLTLVMSPLKKMRENELDPKQKDLYNLMYRNCLRMLRLVNQLLDIRKIDNGQLKMHFIETDIIYFIKDIMQSFNNLSVSRKIDFSMDCSQDTVNLWIDQGNFDKIIFNILSNAFKYTPDNGKISISVSDPKENNNILKENVRQYVELTIENTGENIEEKHLGKLFERFYQVDIKDANMGSGVGLNLAKMLVDLHHGDISAFNTTNGVAFRVRIPVGCSHLNSEEMTQPENHKDLYTKNTAIHDELSSNEDLTYNAEESSAEGGINAKSRKRVILVDDDSEMRAYLKIELQSIYNVETFSNAKEAWARISTTIPDAVITDLVMEKMDGSELCEKIKKNPGTNHIPVIILTSSSDEYHQQKCIESGADRFFTKPISLAILKSAVALAISTRDTIRNKFGRDIDYGYGDIKMTDSDNQLAAKVINIIKKNIENTEFSVEELSHEVGMSRVHLNRKLKETMNISPSNLIRSMRLKQAAYLLINNKVNISEVAYKVGFSTHSYFSNSFHDYFGMTPKEFTAQYMNCTDDETLKKLFG